MEDQLVLPSKDGKATATGVPARQDSREGRVLCQDFITNLEIEITGDEPANSQGEELVKVFMTYWKRLRMATKVKYDDIEGRDHLCASEN